MRCELELYYKNIYSKLILIPSDAGLKRPREDADDHESKRVRFSEDAGARAGAAAAAASTGDEGDTV